MKPGNADPGNTVLTELQNLPCYLCVDRFGDNDYVISVIMHAPMHTVSNVWISGDLKLHSRSVSYRKQNTLSFQMDIIRNYLCRLALIASHIIRAYVNVVCVCIITAELRWSTRPMVSCIFRRGLSPFDGHLIFRWKMWNDDNGNEMQSSKLGQFYRFLMTMIVFDGILVPCPNYVSCIFEGNFNITLIFLCT